MTLTDGNMRVQYTSPSAFVCLTFSTIRNFKMSKAKTHNYSIEVQVRVIFGKRRKAVILRGHEGEIWGPIKFYFLIWVMVTCVFTLWCFSYWSMCLYIVCFLMLYFNQNPSLSMQKSRLQRGNAKTRIYSTR